MKFAMLASGSKGNCFVVFEKGFQMVIDCGTSKRYINSCLEQFGSSIDQTDALLITHDHKDHIGALSAFSKIPTYASVRLDHKNQFLIQQEQEFYLGPMKIYPIALSHDAINTTGYILETQKEKLVYITDTGYLRQDSIQRIKNADYYILESNHDVEMLMNTSRPYFLKQRILGDDGHLNNEDAARILCDVIGENTKSIFLAHCSEQANTQELALKTTLAFLQQAHPELLKQIQVEVCAPRKIVKGGYWYEEELADCTVSSTAILEPVSH